MFITALFVTSLNRKALKCPSPVAWVVSSGVVPQCNTSNENEEMRTTPSDTDELYQQHPVEGQGPDKKEYISYEWFYLQDIKNNWQHLFIVLKVRIVVTFRVFRN